MGKAQIAVGKNGKMEMQDVRCFYRSGNAFVHHDEWGEDYTVSNSNCGYLYRKNFENLKSAKMFADYIASVPLLNDISEPKDATNLKTSHPEIVKEMKKKYQQIIDGDAL